MFMALVIATAASLAPPYLAGRAIDDGIRGHGHQRARPWSWCCSWCAALVNWAATYAQTYLVSWVGQRALQDLRVAHLRPPPEAVGRLLLAQQGRRADLAHDQRRGSAGPARHRRRRDAVPVHRYAARHRGDPALLDPRLALVTFPCFPVLLRGSIAFRIASPEAYRLPGRRSRSITAYLQETLSGVRIVRAFGQERRHETRFAGLNDDNREANMRPSGSTPPTSPRSSCCRPWPRWPS